MAIFFLLDFRVDIFLSTAIRLSFLVFALFLLLDPRKRKLASFSVLFLFFVLDSNAIAAIYGEKFFCFRLQGYLACLFSVKSSVSDKSTVFLAFIHVYAA